MGLSAMGQKVELLSGIDLCGNCMSYSEKNGQPFCKERLTIDELFNCWNIRRACSNYKDSATAYIESRIW